MDALAVKTLFQERRIEGHAAEDACAFMLYHAGWIVGRVNANYRQDIVATRGAAHERIEVKCEDRYATTGNLCIELSQGNPRRSSGLSTSESTVCIHTLGDMAALYRTQPMRLWIVQQNRLGDGRYSIQQFRESDNFNAGIVLPIKDVRMCLWFDCCPLKDIATSRVFGGNQ